MKSIWLVLVTFGALFLVDLVFPVKARIAATVFQSGIALEDLALRSGRSVKEYTHVGSHIYHACPELVKCSAGEWADTADRKKRFAVTAGPVVRALLIVGE